MDNIEMNWLQLAWLGLFAVLSCIFIQLELLRKWENEFALTGWLFFTLVSLLWTRDFLIASLFDPIMTAMPQDTFILSFVTSSLIFAFMLILIVFVWGLLNMALSKLLALFLGINKPVSSNSGRALAMKD
jgi:Na+-transporting methylmalonyl-CoA/oxaloacetate decarboxylase gamma subunit